jgi:hypothetical protein
MLLDQAREAGAREMVLEVIVENAPAIALYEKLGFARTREFEVLSLAAATEDSEASETDLGEGLKVIAATRGGPEPWQRADETVAKLVRRGPPPRAISVAGASAVFSEDGDRLSLLQAAGDAAGLVPLAAALRSRGKRFGAELSDRRACRDSAAPSRGDCSPSPTRDGPFALDARGSRLRDRPVRRVARPVVAPSRAARRRPAQ